MHKGALTASKFSPRSEKYAIGTWEIEFARTKLAQRASVEAIAKMLGVSVPDLRLALNLAGIVA